MSRYCYINAPEKCNEIASQINSEVSDYDELTDEQQSEMCTLCAESLYCEVEYFYGD